MHYINMDSQAKSNLDCPISDLIVGDSGQGWRLDWNLQFGLRLVWVISVLDVTVIILLRGWLTMLPCCQIWSVCHLALLRIAGNCRQFAWPRPGLNHRTRAPATAETGSWPRQCLPPEQMPWTNLYSSWVLKNMFEYRKHLSKYISSKVD